MGQLLVRKLDDEVIQRMRSKAKASGTSLEELARRTLTESFRPSRESLLAEIDRIRAMSIPSDFDSTAVIRRLREGDDDGD